ncbi:fumarylacetoacetate hydrolase family protein [Terrihalobacillus insolitus]|uniref:fumarylacetoacetate hydrolase family protein n=1 Tax=Terrihalobacillus insolitus TaxID=2950438 RepID=UPI002340F7FC|nr:fumarylacetoacetate hydrolase family protein [Terrihalobacillus insolitus]MDC3411898.1 fumarylacetoacetate hydrolase family protein [Terrihalobacillus insolitus]
MKLALYNDFNLGVIKGDRIFEIGSVINWDSSDPQNSLLDLMENYNRIKSQIEEAITFSESKMVSEVKLNPPVPKPSKIVAAPVNYYLHQDEMNEQFKNAEYTIENLGFFLKAPSSIIGPNDKIKLPFPDRRTDHEAELAFVVGKRAKDVLASEAADYIFGYFALMDITVRGKEDRPWRKSFDTFTPIGPWIVTSDEIVDPNNLAFKLWVNGEERQSANTKDLIYDCYKFFEVASSIMTLEPGDILTTGTPEGVGPITKDDEVRITIDRIGEFSVSVDYKKEEIKNG